MIQLNCNPEIGTPLREIPDITNSWFYLRDVEAATDMTLGRRPVNALGGKGAEPYVNSVPTICQ